MGEGLSPNPAQSHHFTPKDLVTSGESLLQRLDSGIYKQHGVMNPSKMFSCLRKFWIYIVVISLLHLSWSEEVTERCRNKGCQVEVEDGTSNDLRCNRTCRQQQMQYCMLGCRTAVDVYERDLQEKVGNLSAPVMIHRTNTTVLLRWNGKIIPNVTYRLQQRYAHKESDDWHNLPSTNITSTRTPIRVDTLHPSIAYEFRVVAIISPSIIVTSPPSVEIVTDSSGPPLVAPRVTSLTCSATTIHVRWSPPFFKNAKIIGYTLTLKERNGSVPKVNVVSGKNVKILTMLQPNTEYEVRIAAMNIYGLGPETRNITFTLPKEESFGATPYLVMVSNHSLRQKNLDKTDRVQSGVIYSDTYSKIVDVAIHYYKDFIFFSNKSGDVYRLSRTNANSVISIYRSTKHPGPLSVDWLHDRIYIAEDRAIISCNLDGSSRSVDLDNLPSRPTHIVADPFNGYLFWSHLDPGGIYKIDLASLGTSIYELSNYSVLQNSPLPIQTFTLDFSNYRLYYPNTTEEILQSVNLDGTDQTDARPEGSVQKTQFHNIVSISIHEGRFYWTNGSKVWIEEYDARSRLYHHNTMYIFKFPFTGFNVWHPTAQPIPVPLQKPRQVQAVFSSRSTTLQWSRPDWDQGKGAWQNWFYEIKVKNLNDSSVKTIKDNHQNDTMTRQPLHLRIADLQPETPYSFRVRAYTSAGHGPWSNSFSGETLKYDGSHPHLLYSCSGSIYRVELDGASYNDRKDLDPRHGIKQLIVINSWYLWLNREHKLYIKKGFEDPRWLANIEDALVISYDWLGEKLYWWNSRNQIFRSSLDGQDVENVYQGFSQAHHLCIDSVEGYMYWATANAVEVAHLNNADLREIARLPQFDSHILGLALDLDQRFLYWLVKENQKTLIYRAALLSRTQSSTGPMVRVAELEHPPPPSIQGMYYYSNRLFWLSSDGSVVVMDTKEAHNVAKLELHSGSKIESLMLVKPIQGLPSALGQSTAAGNSTTVGSSIAVIPAHVQPSSVDISGPWDAFNISWKPTPVKHGQVYYQLLLTFGPERNEIIKRTILPYLLITNVSGIRPFMRLHLSMKSCTFWGCSPISTRDLVTPMSEPSPPRNPRGFVSFRRTPLRSDFTVEVELHWSPPQHCNGRLRNYTIYYQQSEGPWTIARVGPNTTFYRKEDAIKNHIYTFKALSCNEVGCSSQSGEVRVDTSKENPVPRLITATDSTIDLFLPDAQTSAELWNRTSAVALTFEAQESALYLLDTSSRIVKLVEVNGHEIVDVSGRGKSIAMDWVGRDLYWLEEEPQGYCEIKTFNIDRRGSTNNRVLQMDMSGSNLAVHPYKSAIFWSATDKDGSWSIMRAYMNGTQKEPVIGRALDDRYGRRRRAAPNCNCPTLSLTSVFAMDHSRTENSELYVVEKASGSIWASDLTGCFCRLVVNATNRKELDLPPDSIAVDHQRLYWSHIGEAKLHSVLKETGAGHLSEPMGGVKQIITIGRHLQPFPDPKCLRMDDYHQAPKKIHQTNTTLSLVLGVWKPHPDCADMSLPRTRYKVYYRHASGKNDTTSCLRPGSHCKEKITYDTEVTLNNLEPYQYQFMEVVADNFYTRDEQRHTTGAYALFITAPGVPSEPRDVSAAPRTPKSIEVRWRVPSVTNGKLSHVGFEVQWWKSQTTRPVSKSEIIISEDETRRSFNFTVNDLEPESSYDFRVVAFYREDRRMGEGRSATATTSTFPTPPLVSVIKKTAHSLIVAWQSPDEYDITRHRIVIVPVDDPESKIKGSEERTKTGLEYNETFLELEPNSRYALYVNATYKTGNYFFWPQETDVNIVRTAPGPPVRPKAPMVELSHRPHIIWRAPNHGGMPINEYWLAARKTRSNDKNWTLVYNGTDTRWVIADLETAVYYEFAVRARNAKGWSEYSPPSKKYSPSPAVNEVVQGKADRLTIILAVSFGVIFLAVLAFAAIMIGSRLMKKHKPVPVDFVNPSPRADVELATLRDLPRNTRQHTNALYAINIVPTAEDVAALPHFRRDCLVLTKFLGSGAFGEVFEGVAKDILGDNTGDSRVAVKTLRKGASGAEKEEFLKEALLMDNFTHTHILHLLGVCLHNDPQFIILELMEGGDLLSYLRNARPTVNRPARLTMADMVAICTDVAKGCKYLEDMHFVHRDLAARNCLVSSIDPTRRVVKIGDFGLARDIYKNDYYRKEGEGLLPVRWMSPESLIDGVFTTYSDVWAFGVLVWEVLTLGQQPYPARTNIEVLNYVRGGGRLDRPDNCPEDLHNVMSKCWCFSPGGRPSFSYLLSELESIKLPGTETSNHYTTTEVSRSMQGNAGQRQADSPYVGPPTPQNRQVPNANRAPSSSIARPRPVARPDHSPYLQPVSHTGGPNKYLELVADDDVMSAARSTSGRGHSDIGRGISAPALHYAQLSGMSDVPDDSDYNSQRVDSPDIHTRVPKCQGHVTKKDSAIDYAQLALSDEADNAVDTDSEEVGTDHPTHCNSRGQRPLGNYRNQSGSTRAGWPHRQNTHYAQIASTDSDTDSEMFVSQDSSTAAPSGAISATPCDDTRSKHGRGWSPAHDSQSQGSFDGLTPYTIDGYLAPKSLCINNKQGFSSCSINSNNTSSGQSGC